MLFPSGPNFRAVANCCLFSVADNGRFHQGRVVENLVLFGPLVVHVLHQGDIRVTAVPIDEIVNAANSPEHTVKFLTGQAETEQVHGLEFHPPLFEIPLGFFRIKAFAFAEYLNVQ